MIANRVSYGLDLLTPSVPVDTACSFSLTATRLAVYKAIRSGDCEAGVVVGIQLNYRIDWVQYSLKVVYWPQTANPSLLISRPMDRNSRFPSSRSK